MVDEYRTEQTRARLYLLILINNCIMHNCIEAARLSQPSYMVAAKDIK